MNNLMPIDVPILIKSTVKQHTRTTKSGKKVNVRQYTNIKTKKVSTTVKPIKIDLGVDIYYDGNKYKVYNEHQVGGTLKDKFAVSKKGHGVIGRYASAVEAVKEAKKLDFQSTKIKSNTKKPLNENNIINSLRAMYLRGYVDKEFQGLMSKIKSDKIKITNPVLNKLYKMSNTVYGSKEVDALLEKLSDKNHDIVKKPGTKETATDQVLKERFEGLTNEKALTVFAGAAKHMFKDYLEEGFDKNDAVKFLSKKLSNIMIEAKDEVREEKNLKKSMLIQSTITTK